MLGITVPVIVVRDSETEISRGRFSRSGGGRHGNCRRVRTRQVAKREDSFVENNIAAADERFGVKPVELVQTTFIYTNEDATNRLLRKLFAIHLGNMQVGFATENLQVLVNFTTSNGATMLGQGKELTW
jgi:hypothetical protein